MVIYTYIYVYVFGRIFGCVVISYGSFRSVPTLEIFSLPSIWHGAYTCMGWLR